MTGLRFKVARLEEELGLVDARLRRVLEDMNLYTEAALGYPLTVTEILGGAGVHSEHRGADVRSKDLPGSAPDPRTGLVDPASFAYELRDWTNGRWGYGRTNAATGRKYAVVVFGDNDVSRKHEDHFHVQVPPPRILLADLRLDLARVRLA